MDPSGHEKPLPQSDPDSQRFWDGCREHKLLVQQCKQCGTYRFPPGSMCCMCQSMDHEWVDVEGRAEQLETLRSGKADAAFTWASEESSKEAGFHSITLAPLPMINGPTITTSLTTLEKKDGWGERLVKAQVLGIHYARSNREKTERILEDLNKRTGRSYKYDSLARMPIKPYPDPQAIINAYELGCMKSPKAKELSPLALWDLHYLRMLDHSGFIDRLYKGAGL